MSVRSRLRTIFRPRERNSRRDRPENDWKNTITGLVPGKSFIDVGCMWGVHGDYAFHAAAHGASPAVGLDRSPATPEFLARNEALGNTVGFFQANIDDPAIEELVGHFDVVFCAGVLYHVPNPLLTLGHLHTICRETLILATPTIPEATQPQSAVFLPQLDSEARRRLAFGTARLKRGLDTAFDPAREYGNWFWLFTPSCVKAMLTTAGFEVREFRAYRRGVMAVCRKTRSAVPSRGLGQHAPPVNLAPRSSA